MRNFAFTLVFVLLGSFVFAQVGVGTSDPESSLDIEATSRTTPTNEDGILIPRLDEFPATDPTNDQDGMMIFITGDGAALKGFYYWDNDIPAWVAIKDSSTIVRAEFSINTEIDRGTAPGTNDNFVHWDKIIFDTQITDTNDEYDPATGRYTAKRAGVYSVTASVVSTFNEDGDPDPVGIAIYKNGTRWQKLDYDNSIFTDYSRSITANIYLAVNDYVEIFFGFPETWVDFDSLAQDKSRLIITSQN